MPSQYKLATKTEKQARTESWELYFNHLVNMTKLKNILRYLVIKNARCELKNATGVIKKCEIKNARCEQIKNARCEIEYREIPLYAPWSRNLALLSRISHFYRDIK